MLPDYKPAATLTEEQRKELASTPTVRICIGTSTLESPLGTIFHLPLGLLNHYSRFLRHHFASKSCAAQIGIYQLTDACPAHFRIIASYVMKGHAKYVSNIGLSICTEGKMTTKEKIKELEKEGPEVVAFCRSAEDINQFIALCDKFKINEAISAVVAAYTLVCRFGSLHDILPVPGFDEDMPWGPLGGFAEKKNEEVWKMVPSKYKHMMEKALKQIVEDKHELEAEVDGVQEKKDWAAAKDEKHALEVKLEEVLKKQDPSDNENDKHAAEVKLAEVLEHI